MKNIQSNKLLVTGGVERENGFDLGPGKYYGKAVLLSLDLNTGKFEELLSIDKGTENFPAEHPNLEFTTGTVEEDKLWMVTDTEIRQYQYPEMKLLKLFSHPCFHNIHSVTVRENHLYVTSTGLDMVVILDKVSGEIVQQINAEGKETWHRFLADFDYRQIHSTRPHDCHPNFVFFIEDNPWVTRCTQGDAACLIDLSKRIDVSGPGKEISIHDGVIANGKIYFTSVDGCLVIADEKTQTVLETINLSEHEGFIGFRGWCRGILIDGDLIYVGFSHLRKTRAVNKLNWVKKVVKSMVVERIELSSVVIFDIKNRKIVNDFRIPEGMLDAVYTILPEPGS